MYDCNRLLQYADSAEADFSALLQQRRRRRRRDDSNNRFSNQNDNLYNDPKASFGHPDPPNLHMFRLCNDESNSPDCVIVIAYTRHTISAQLLHSTNSGKYTTSKNQPIEICMLIPEDDNDGDDDDNLESENNDDDCTLEYITCLNAVVLEHLELTTIAANDKIHVFPDTQRLEHDNFVEESQKSLETQEMSTDPSILKSWSGSFTSASSLLNENQPNNFRFAIIFGTNHSHLYTVEVKVERSNTGSDGNNENLWNMERVNITSPVVATASHVTMFHVLPIDTSATFLDTQDVRGSRTKYRRKGLYRIHSLSSIGDEKSKHSAFPFMPTGGIQNISTFRIPNRRKLSVYAWVTYGDGTIVRLHHAAFFPTVWLRGADEQKSIETFLCDAGCSTIKSVIVRYKVRLPSTIMNSPYSVPMVVPLPLNYPSPLGNIPFPISGYISDDTSDCEIKPESGVCDSLLFPPPTLQALVFGQGGPSDALPTLCFYTSEHQYINEKHESFGDLVDDSHTLADSNILGSVTKTLLGSAMGALRWGFGNTSEKSREFEKVDESDLNSRYEGSRHTRTCDESSSSLGVADEENSIHDSTGTISPFPSLWQRPIELCASIEFHDAPRQIEFCSVDPDGSLAAATDGLGRVLLIDLESKQLIRMWKGFRESRCYWHQTQHPTHPDRISLYLVIHSHQRRIVEVWKVRHGARVLSRQVGRDAIIVPCRTWSRDTELSTCYILHSRLSGTTLNHLENIVVGDATPVSLQPISSSESVRSSSLISRSVPLNESSEASVTSVRSAALRLQRLQQLLSTTTVEFTMDDVEKSLQDIKSLSDLSIALDLLAVGTLLEIRLGITDSSFHKSSVKYCSDILNKALRKSYDNASNPHANTNPHIRVLSKKIAYHSQVRRS
jgi:Rab3 GTPase-activating protein regulatory subunit N-terminus